MDKDGYQEACALFYADAKDRLQVIENTLLESEGKNWKSNDIENLFRVIHALKGGASALKWNELSDLSHLFESVLEILKYRSIIFEDQVVNFILDLKDAMVDCLERHGENLQNHVLEDLKKRFETIFGGVRKFRGSTYAIFYDIDSRNDPSNRIDGTPHTDLSKVVDQTIRIKINVVDTLVRLVGDLVQIRNEQKNLKSLDGFLQSSKKLDRLTKEIQSQVLTTRLQSIQMIFSKIPRIVKNIADKLHKKINFRFEGSPLLLDRSILESLEDPLLQIIKNSCDHGAELPNERIRKNKPSTCTLLIKTSQENGFIHIIVQDDGKGINVAQVKSKGLSYFSKHELDKMNSTQLLDLIFLPGLSTSEKITDLSGRGVGLDLVKSTIEKMHGKISISSEIDIGTTFHLRVPISISIVLCLSFISEKSFFSIPYHDLEEVVDFKDVAETFSGSTFKFRSQSIPVLDLESVLKNKKPSQGVAENHKGHFILILRAGLNRFGLIVESLLGSEELVLLPPPRVLKKLYAGGVLLGRGDLSMVLNMQFFEELLRDNFQHSANVFVR